MPSFINNPTALYQEAWGKQWAQHGGTILREDVIPAGQPAEGHFDIPERLDYVCLDGMSKIRGALTLTTHVEESLVVRDEYVKLREAMEGISPKAYRTVGVVVMGQQGIGSLLSSHFLPNLSAHIGRSVSQGRLPSSSTSFCIAWRTNSQLQFNSVLIATPSLTTEALRQCLSAKSIGA
jgi:hypothetical protein